MSKSESIASNHMIITIPVASNKYVEMPTVSLNDNLFTRIADFIEYSPANDEILCFPLSKDYSLWVAEDSKGNMPVNRIATLAFAVFYGGDADPIYGDAVITGKTVDGKPTPLTPQSVFELFEMLSQLNQENKNKEKDTNE